MNNLYIGMFEVQLLAKSIPSKNLTKDKGLDFYGISDEDLWCFCSEKKTCNFETQLKKKKQNTCLNALQLLSM